VNRWLTRRSGSARVALSRALFNGPPTQGAGTIRGRESVIALAGRYEIGWRDFSVVSGGRYGTFRYLAVAVS
jgi:hypothetical protein